MSFCSTGSLEGEGEGECGSPLSVTSSIILTYIFGILDAFLFVASSQFPNRVKSQIPKLNLSNFYKED